MKHPVITPSQGVIGNQIWSHKNVKGKKPENTVHTSAKVKARYGFLKFTREGSWVYKAEKSKPWSTNPVIRIWIGRSKNMDHTFPWLHAVSGIISYMSQKQNQENQNLLDSSAMQVSVHSRWKTFFWIKLHCICQTFVLLHIQDSPKLRLREFTKWITVAFDYLLVLLTLTAKHCQKKWGFISSSLWLTETTKATTELQSII